MISLAIITSISATSSASKSGYDGTGTSPPIPPKVGWSLGVGTLGPGSILEWSWHSTEDLTFSVRKPDLSTINGLQSTGGMVITQSGFYILGWYNGGSTNASVTYSWATLEPRLEVSSPEMGIYTNTTISVRGTYDGYADGVLVGIDALHLREANKEGTNWSIEDLALREGSNTILIRSYFLLDPAYGGNYTMTCTVQVALDTVHPMARVIAPGSDESIRGNNVDVLWNCSDDTSVERVDIRTDGGAWRTVHWGMTWGLGNERIRMGDGRHTLEIRATDVAGNQATASTAFVVNSDALSFGGPYYGYPLIAALAGSLAIVATALPVLRRNRRRIAPPPENKT